MPGICVLAPWEVTALKQERQTPNCRQHRHIGKLEACQMSHSPNDVGSPYARPIARWIGPKQIELLQAYEWKMIDRWRFPRYNLLPQGAERRR